MSIIVLVLQIKESKFLYQLKHTSYSALSVLFAGNLSPCTWKLVSNQIEITVSFVFENNAIHQNEARNPRAYEDRYLASKKRRSTRVDNNAMVSHVPNTSN